MAQMWRYGCYALIILLSSDINIASLLYINTLTIISHQYRYNKYKIIEATEDVKLPALKKELISYEFSLRWNYIPIERAFRRWFKEMTYNTIKIDIMMLDYVKECFIESGGSNLLIDWKETFALINNEVKVSRNSTNRVELP
ncbi:hypothetical protein GLOIN_2v1479957 [Rhizophagus irregularis DAOM 181602=DAOM 197198]|uniref:Uncharacterized protein n=1 Tax=Rhizophagus irregularis (strain DAOM 181602 / DAOM 197198 / MUCL 43194) TaxID=747089 RepID=U9TPL5_RHIID|nr:hypothetical protein GLOIN_2v1479957 [Rhizophagus irregularis DAOM 181602=DAOM 197198]